MAERKDDRLWGGRFERAPNEEFDAFQRSFAFDRRLLPYEIAVDRAWAKALEPIGIFTVTEVKQTLSALDKIAERAKTDSAWLESFGASAEDVHHFVEKALVEELGPLGWKLHTGRSRNELVATDFRLFVIDAASEVQRGIETLLNSFLLQAKANLSVPMAGMTHMQHAQPILLSHFLLAHAEAFTRDMTRLQHAAESADICPMGSGALAGNSFAIDRHAIARELGFSSITGSSLMPQKKNPDAWELIRGKTGRITGALLGLLTTLKGLPTSYQRDLQEDKETLFAAHDQVSGMLAIATGAISATKFNAERLRAAASNPALLATEAADYLVRKGVPFRQAHDIVGKVLRGPRCRSKRSGKSRLRLRPTLRVCLASTRRWPRKKLPAAPPRNPFGQLLPIWKHVSTRKPPKQEPSHEHANCKSTPHSRRHCGGSEVPSGSVARAPRMWPYLMESGKPPIGKMAAELPIGTAVAQRPTGTATEKRLT